MNFWDDLMSSLDHNEDHSPSSVEIMNLNNQIASNLFPLKSTASSPAALSANAISSIFNNGGLQQTAQYRFPPEPVSMARNINLYDILGRENGQEMQDNEGLNPFPRPRVTTWDSTVSDSGYSGLSHNSENGQSRASSSSSLHKNGQNGIQTSKRRATCPESMRNYQRRPRTSSMGQKRNISRINDEDSDNDDMDNELSMYKDLDSGEFTSRLGEIELTITRQPESHHRARYQKEGSRGCIKDRTGNSCPAVQLKGYSAPSAILQAFIGTESGPVRPHPLYRVCKVGGKHSTPCREKMIEGSITALEMDLTRDNNFTLNVDCLGIMKLRNADFEQFSEADDLTKRRKRSPKVRLIFRALVKLPNGDTETLQVVSTPICCTPSPGVPEIHFLSHTSAPASGGVDIVVIGRNFVKDDSKLYVVEKNMDDVTLWEKEVPLLNENFNQVHLVGTIPPYHDPLITRAAEVLLFVRNKGGKQSEPSNFKYTPDEAVLRTMGSALASAASIPTAMITPTMDIKGAFLNQMDPNSGGVINIQQLGGLVQTGPQDLRYCIQLPGAPQPIIISVPNNAALAQQNSMMEQASVHQVNMDYNQHGMVDQSGMALNQAAAQMQMQNQMQRAHGQSSEEELFNELLQEILSCPGGEGEGMAMDTLPSQSDGNAAAMATNSMRDLDLNQSNMPQYHQHQSTAMNGRQMNNNMLQTQDENMM